MTETIFYFILTITDNQLKHLALTHHHNVLCIQFPLGSSFAKDTFSLNNLTKRWLCFFLSLKKRKEKRRKKVGVLWYNLVTHFELTHA